MAHILPTSLLESLFGNRVVSMLEWKSLSEYWMGPSMLSSDPIWAVSLVAVDQSRLSEQRAVLSAVLMTKAQPSALAVWSPLKL